MVINILLLVELLGTIAFACSGAIVAVKKDLDLLGILVIGVITAVGGGMLRDVLLGEVPPTLFFKPIYVITAFLSALVVFLMLRFDPLNLKIINMKHFDSLVNQIDAIGLGVFTATGVSTALELGYHDNYFLTIFLGVLTGVGGGLLRDILVGQTPFIFHKHFYACAAICGGICYRLLLLKLPQLLALLISTCTVWLIRVLARRYQWKLPKIQTL